MSESSGSGSLLAAQRHSATAPLWAWLETADLTQEAKDKIAATATELDAELIALDNGHWSRTSGPEWTESGSGYGNY